MKKSFHITSLAALIAACTLVSCNKEIEKVDAPEDKVIETPQITSLTFSIGENETTKTVLAEADGKLYGNWESDDAIGYLTSDDDAGSAAVTPGDPASFTISATSGFAADDIVYAWYPFRWNMGDKTKITMAIPVSQMQDGDTFDFDAMPMVAEPITITSGMLNGDSEYEGTIDFVNLGSLIEFKVFSSNPTYASEKVAAITFDAGSSNIAGHFNMNVSAVDFSNVSTLEITGYTGKSVTTSLASPAAIGTSKETAKDVYMVVAPGTYTGNIIVATDAAFYTIPISGKEFERSGMKSFGLDLAKSVDTRRSLKGSFTWQLNQISYSSASATSATWPYGLITMTAAKASASTATNNYLPPFQSNGSAADNSRFYKNSTLTFTPSSLWVEKVVFTAGTSGYATALSNSSWTNATASASETTVTIVPTNGASAFSATIGATTGGTSMKVYFDNTDYTVSKAAVSNGTLSVDKATAKVNEVITVTATPNSEYVLSGISVKDASNNDVVVEGTTFKMPASNVTVSATFVASGADPSITIASCSNGTVSTSPSGTVTAGTTVTITATPNAGYLLNSLAVRDALDNVITVNSSNEFTMPATDVTITASFVPGYALTNAQVVQALSATDVSTDKYGDITFTSTPGNWSANVNTKKTLTYMQLRNKSGSKLASPTYASNIDKVVIKVASNQSTSRNIHLIPSSTEVPTTDSNYTSTLWSSQYGTVASGTGSSKKTITFSTAATSFILVVEGGTTYIDEIEVFLK